MRVNWRVKSLGFAAIDAMGAKGLLYFLQKNVTRRARAHVVRIDPIWERHYAELAARTDGGTLFEFGAGKHLGQNLFLSPLFEHQIVVDLNPMLDFDLLAAALDTVAARSDRVTARAVADLAALEAGFGISYRAPFDARDTGLAPGSLDAVVSTNTLEHIPEADIRAILAELHRILRPGGVISARIDYSDHYAHTDPRIGLLNYLQFSEEAWRRHNHPSHYQNRLRHYDHRRLFEEAGFEIAVDDPEFAETAPPPRIDAHFDADDPTCRATAGHFVALRRP